MKCLTSLFLMMNSLSVVAAEVIEKDSTIVSPYFSIFENAVTTIFAALALYFIYRYIKEFDIDTCIVKGFKPVMFTMFTFYWKDLFEIFAASAGNF